MPTLTDWQQDSYFQQFSFAKEADYSIFVKHAGDTNNPALLLIHGFPTSSYDWQPIWQSLSAQFHVITLDMIGFGLSDKPTQFHYSFAAQANLIEQILASLKITNVHILSHDYGNTVTQELLARQQLNQPNYRILSTVLLNGGIFPEVIHPILIQRLLLSPLGFLVAKRMGFKAFKRNFDTICTINISESELQKHWQLIKHHQGERVFHKLIQYMKERKVNRDRWVNALIDNPTPMRFINGLDDPISGQDMLERYETLIDTPDTISLHDIGHYPQLEAPSLVLKHAMAFWQRHQIIG
ncbi:Fluoroacetate dehalogenase [Shewanella sp. P1-14-1]|uniref:alpha/beta fold hydrolase n=1 Tax=Shewanella sp. P1-14-1 TaxID=1723761 RepID=UPI0006D65D19|nr:alpha/beta hydrolase [Shewanella sp. P1-14-1]KPZ68215.1 Fluoroacetate dehalogenase [Shewanella sp. P1-14-1]